MGDLWVLIGSSLYLYLSLFTLTGTPFLLSGDQVFYWMDAEHMMAGWRIYRDFFKFTPPGTDMLYFGFFKVLGLRIWVPNLIVFLLGVALTWVCFRIAAMILERSYALLAASLFLVFIYGALLNATHHLFSELIVLGAVAVLMQGENDTRIMSAGLLLGVATFFTQTRGPVAFAALALYLAWERWRISSSWTLLARRVGLMFISSICAWAILSSYFIATTGLRQLWYWEVLYSMRFKVTGADVLGLPGGLSGWHGYFALGQILAVYVMLPVVYALSLWACLRERGKQAVGNSERRLMLTLVGLATGFEVALSPNWLRVYCVAAPGILLLVWVVSRTGRMQRHIACLMWIGLICLAAQQIRARHRDQSTVAQLPAGRVATFKPAAEKLVWVGQHTRPGDFFFQPAWPGVYLPLYLQSPTYAEAFNVTDETRPEYVTRSIDEVEARQVRYILWAPRLNGPRDAAHPESYHLTPFRDYMQKHYRMVWVFPDRDEVWERQ
jgi:Dolichyl-phosphate-mannose-protein mannosyltransferase